MDKNNLVKQEKTSNGYQIYYDETSGETVGVVYKNIVFLKHVSKKTMTWYEAAAYCKTIVINGITAQLCPVDNSLQYEFENLSRGLYRALKEIGAVMLKYYSWAAEYSKYHAWYQGFSNGYIDKGSKSIDFFYVRPVLIL